MELLKKLRPPFWFSSSLQALRVEGVADSFLPWKRSREDDTDAFYGVGQERCLNSESLCMSCMGSIGAWSAWPGNLSYACTARFSVEVLELKTWHVKCSKKICSLIRTSQTLSNETHHARRTPRRWLQRFTTSFPVPSGRCWIELRVGFQSATLLPVYLHVLLRSYRSTGYTYVISCIGACIQTHKHVYMHMFAYKCAEVQLGPRQAPDLQVQS